MKSYSLKLSFIIPFALLVLVSSLALSLTYYWSSSRNISEFRQQSMRAAVTHIAEDVYHYLDNMSDALRVAAPRGETQSGDMSQYIDSLRDRLWLATNITRELKAYVYYGNKQGQFFGLRRVRGQKFEVLSKLDAQGPRRNFQFYGKAGVASLLGQEDTIYDPRQRPWYELAKDSDQDIWTPVYVDYDTSDLMVTRGRRVLNEQGELDGVAGVDITLTQISQFLRDVSKDKLMQAFIVDAKGRLVAAKSVEQLMQGKNQQLTQTNVAEIGNATMSAAYAVVADFVADNQGIAGHAASGNTRQAETTTADGQRIFVAAQRVDPTLGLDWYVVSAVSKSAILAGVKKQLWIALGMGLVAVLLTILVGVMIFWRLADDIQKLSHTVVRICKGDYRAKVDVERNDEIGTLAEHVDTLRTGLFTDALTGIANRTAFTSLFDSLSGRQVQAFVLYFIDLDNFKPLNDQYGHDNGDRALVEIAQRIKNNIRPQDFVARLGGDEFLVVIVGDLSEQALEKIATQLETAIQEPLTTLKDIPDGAQVRVGASIGYAVWPKHGEDQQALIKYADEAMYRVKRGRGRPDIR